MRLCRTVACLTALLWGSLLSCRPLDQGQNPAPTSIPANQRADPTLFTGNSGIPTRGIETMTGPIDGNPIGFDPHKSFPLQARTDYNVYTPRASMLAIQAYSDQYSINLYINGPFEAGRNDRIYNAGEGKLDPYIARPFIRVPEGQTGWSMIDLKPADEQIRIAAITADYIDIERLFTLSKPGTVPERITRRIKNDFRGVGT